MDFSEFINELMIKFTGSYAAPNAQELGGSIERHMNIQKYDGNEYNQDNKFNGININSNNKSADKERYE